MQSVARKEKRSKPWDRILNRGTTTSENKSEMSWKSTAYASVKVVADVVKESSDVFPPLKSVVGGLTAILKHYDVRPASSASPMILMYYPQQATANRQAIEQLIPRVERLAESVRANVSESETKEHKRRETLKW